MKRYSLTHLADHALLQGLASLVSRDRALTAELLAHVAEVDARQLFAPAGYPSMFQYCVGELHMSEDAAFKRIQVARAARQYPVVFPMIEDGSLNLTSVVLLAPHLTRKNADELLAAGAHKTKAEVQELLAARFPQPDLPTLVSPVAHAVAACQLVPEPVGMTTAEHSGITATGRAARTGLVQVEPPARVAPLSPQRVEFKFTASREAHDLMLYAQALLGHAVPNASVEEIFLQGMRALVEKLEKRRIGAGSRIRARRSRADSRYIPAAVRATVWKRDHGRCTFVGDRGHRCDSSTGIQFDHIEPVARGGMSTASNLRLRCRAHNQYEADRAFGKGFMGAKRSAAKARAEVAKASRPEGVSARTAAEARRLAPEATEAQVTAVLEVVPVLRAMGCGADEALHFAQRCLDMPDASLELRARHAFSGLGAGCGRRVVPAPR